MALIDAYDTRTGTKLPYRVPEHWIGHAVLGRHLSRLPSQRTHTPTPRLPTPPPASPGSQSASPWTLSAPPTAAPTPDADPVTTTKAPAAGDDMKVQ